MNFRTPLHLADITENLKPLGNVERIIVAEPTSTGDSLRAAAIDAIHSYLAHAAGYELSATVAPLNRVALCMEAHAHTLAQRGRAEQEQ